MFGIEEIEESQRGLIDSFGIEANLRLAGQYGNPDPGFHPWANLKHPFGVKNLKLRG